MEKLVCDCVAESGEPINEAHEQYVDVNGDTIIECHICGRFIKVKEPQPDVPTKSE